MKRLVAIVSLILVASLLTSGIAEAKREFGGKRQKIYHTYTKVNKSGEVYVGRTSGYDTPAKNIQRRDARHHMNKQGFKRANLDKSSPNKNAIRGREQQLIEKYRDEGKSANKINGISDKNPKKKRYIGSSTKKFGKP